MKPILLILTGHAPDALRTRLGDFDAWFKHALALPAAATATIDVSVGAPLPAAGELAGAIISGSAAMVTEHWDWSERLAGWVRTATDADLPLLGVCYGHQLMAYALGGEVGALPGGRQMGTQTLTLAAPAHADPLLSGLPDRFPVQTTHQQGVLRPPAEAQVLACTARDPYHVLRYGPHAASTQLHPEFSVEAMRAYIELRAAALRTEGLDVDAMLAAVRPTPHASELLQRFGRLCGHGLGTTRRASA